MSVLPCIFVGMCTPILGKLQVLFMCYVQFVSRDIVLSWPLGLLALVPSLPRLGALLRLVHDGEASVHAFDCLYSCKG